MTERAAGFPAGEALAGQRIDRVAVVMPAHNEDQHLDRALAAVRAAADTLQRERPEVETAITVVLDSCTDRSADIAAGYVALDRRFAAVQVRLGSTGASRAAGVRAAGITMPAPGAAVMAAAGMWAGRVWLANTDADSAVPEHWLVRQVELADAGADAVLGSVEPDPAGTDPAVLRRWRERHPFREDHPHIYGANFGVRASAYLAAGGFPRMRAHEDRTLVENLRKHAYTVLATDTIRVLTSGRTHARAPQGFAAHLRALALDVPVLDLPVLDQGSGDL
ncbi:glycosyltransferase family 2 protein [Arthrobacter sp. Y81]|uniref:glycosyltransferase n=1 Tax=Arthrobacter sp. Y81 TaxID=2058897 RepID=UPI0015E3BB4B|nr:glycosyltransferase [Arthrobacter sp. Y81]